MQFLSQNFVKYGLIMVAVMVGCLALMELTGQNQTFEHSPWAAFSTFVAPPLVWFLGLRAKKKAQEGRLTYRQGLGEGFKISVVYAILSPFVTLAYYTLVNPPIVASTREAYGLLDATDATVIQVDMFVQLVSALVWGTLCGAVLSLFLRTKTKENRSVAGERRP